MPHPTPYKRTPGAPKKHKTTWKPGTPVPAPSYPKVLAFGSLTTAPHFDGPTYDPKQDHGRLTGQLLRVYTLMKDGKWRTIDEIVFALRQPKAVSHTGVSARLRDLRKEKFGGYTVEHRRAVEGAGLYEYRIATP